MVDARGRGHRCDGAAFTVASSLAFVVVPDEDQEQPVMPGDRVSGVIDAFELTDTYTITLEAGDRIDVSVATPSGDMWFEV